MNERHLLLYVTIDTANHRAQDGSPGAHATNYGNLQEMAAAWRPGVRMDHAWCPQVTAETLDDPRLLALILSGSFTEWVEAVRQPAWRRQLDDWCALLRQTRAPTLAICGSHQLIAYAYGGWDAVGHMAPAGHPPIAVSSESDGVFRAPNPRVGEVGVYRFKTERNDPILAGLPDRTYFVEYHHDEVLLPALPPGVCSLLEPDGIDDAIQRPAYDMGASAVAPGAEAQTFGHRPVLAPEERSRAQALRYAVPPAGRLLYTMQFHPDLVWRSPTPQARHAQEHSRLLFSNFLDLADTHWNQ